MEGPSIVIATEELNALAKKKILKVTNHTKWDLDSLKGQSLEEALSWGKHLILKFPRKTLRIHFLMFGSYRIDDPRENRIPKLQLDLKDHKIYFYSCAIKEIENNLADYDWTTDVMSDEWDSKKALHKLKDQPKKMICDLLLDQEIFSGVGNIIKNEVLFRAKLHPEEIVDNLTSLQLRKLVSETQKYCFQFYEWKKDNILRRNWLVFKKKKCPVCERELKKKHTGKLVRRTFFCSHCQKKSSNKLK